MSYKLSLIVPVYNEWKTIRELLQKILALNLTKEIVIVDDASTDGTSQILDSISDPVIRLFRHKVNQGKGAAIRTALKECSGDIVIIQDADLEQDPDDIYHLIEPILNRGAEVVYGSRFLKERPKMQWSTYWANQFLSALASFLYGQKITDLETCYKVFRADIIKGLPLKENGFEFEPEVTAKLLKRGYKIYEVPIKEDWYHGYDNNSKKVTWVDGLKAIVTLIKYRFSN